MLRLLPFLPLLLVCAAPPAPPTFPNANPPAAPSGWSSTPAPSEAPDPSRVFAAQLLSITEDITRVYVRPVKREELLRAALLGLFEEVHQPFPEELNTDLDRCLGKDLLADSQPSDEALVLLLARTRADLGNPEPFHNGGDLRVAVQGMMRCLDPYCGLVTGDDLRRGAVMEETRFDFGFEWSDEGNAVRIKSVLLGGPAQRAGLRPGDEITHCNGQPIRDPESGKVPGAWHGYDAFATRPAAARNSNEYAPVPDSITLKIQPHGASQARTVKLDRETYKPETVLGVRRDGDGVWDYWLDAEQKIAHVRLGALEHGVGDELTEVLARLKSGGLRGLILDLRWSPGGFLASATQVAGVFIKEGVVCKTRSRNRFSQWEEQEYNAHGIADFLDFPMVVLVNEETSGGAELIAAALQDHCRAVVVGQRTRGKASIQTQEPLPIANTGLKLTSGSFLRPSGKALHRFPDSKLSDDWGVRPAMPEQETPMSADLSKQLREWWMQQSWRPGGDRELLPLDDPENDPQRQTALRVLEQILQKQ